MDARQRRITEIERALGKRGLIFFGTRGADAEPLLAIPQFEEVFSQIAPLDAISVRETCLETLTSERVDLDSYDIDGDKCDAVRKIRGELLKAFARPAVVLAYRPCALLASAWFPRSEHVTYLGLFHGAQGAFEHKAWVESELRSRGVSTLPWVYYADNEADLIAEWSRVEPVVVRANRTDGGVGVKLVRSPGELGLQWPDHGDGFVAAAPYIYPSIPLNINACVFANGKVSLHPASVQLIGIPEATNRAFGYCGNDFARVAELSTPVLTELERITRITGRWLAENGYRGAFGVDVLVQGSRVFLTEVNPRFQGSSLVSAVLDAELDRPDVFLEHAATFLGLDPLPGMSLPELASQHPPRSHVVQHNKSATVTTPVSQNIHELAVQCRLIPDTNIKVKPEAAEFQAVFAGGVTEDGRSLLPEITEQVRALRGELYGHTAVGTPSAKTEQ